MNQGLAISKTKEQITDAGARLGKVVPPGTVLLSFKLSIGKVGIAEVPLYTNEAIAALPIKNDRVLDARYLMRSLQAMDLAGGSNRAAMGATLNKKSLAAVQISLPSLPEQRRIAAILDRTDALRTKRRQVLAHLDSLTQSIFHNTFGHASEWPTQRLDSLVADGDRINYGVVQPGDDTPGGVPLIRVSDLAAGTVNRANLKRIAPGIENSYARSRLRGNEILVSSVGSIGVIGLAGPDDVGSNIARAITRVPISDSTLRTYIACYLRTATPQRYFVSELRTVAQPTLNVGQLAATSVPVPPRDLQARFGDRLREVQAAAALVAHASQRDDELFASLQSRAFRGEL
ncbi:type I restriction enzyme S subunit [Flexivirga oryzae]|uniref:Type I restriction enzyme S subunit n=2 Tax=Flexivirga oryzae TaxID=1794944 RepID=A0A839NF13_9MICO|nr:type I restriction enzyme S subunit [Flexivirga oryzae]